MSRRPGSASRISPSERGLERAPVSAGRAGPAGLGLPRPLHPADLRATINVVRRGRYWVAARLMMNLRLPHESIVR